MNNIGDKYYERGVYFFELGKYEQAVEDWIHAYELGYNTEKILENVYQCFVIPNEDEFQKNYECNNKGITQLSYDDCILDFIPVSDEKYYIFNHHEAKFEGNFVLGKTSLQGKRIEENSVLYTDTWDIREIVEDVQEQKYGMVYLLLGDLEAKFVSFLKLPLFKELYMKKIMLFHDVLEMKSFFLKQPYKSLPKQMVTEDTKKYLAVMSDIQNEKRKVPKHNIMFLMGQSQYGALRRLINDTAAGFRKIGYNTLVVDMMQEDFWQQIFWAKENYEFDAAITYNLMGCDSDAIRHIGKKYCSLMCDHPIWHEDRLPYADEDTIVWYGDRYNLNYVKKYYPNIGRVRDIMGPSDYFQEDVAYSDRLFDLVFIGSYSRPEEIYDYICNIYSGSVLELVKAFIEKLVVSPNLTYEDGLRETLDDFGLNDIVDEQFRDTAGEFRWVNKYIRSYYRDKIIREIIQNGIAIHVSGNGWENFESEYRDNIVIENNDWYTAKKMIANAKISLNVMPWFKAGFHDRAVSSMLSGSILLTDSSEFIEENFRDMDNVVIYHLDGVQAIPEKIKYLLSHEKKAERIAENGREFAMKNFSWKKMAEDMAEDLREEIGDKTELVGEGCELSISQKGARRKSVARNIIGELKDIDQILDSFQSGTTCKLIQAKDYQYVVSQLKDVAQRLVSDFPDLEVGDYVWNQITDLHDDIPSYIPELIRMQLAYLMKVVLWDCIEGKM